MRGQSSPDATCQTSPRTLLYGDVVSVWAGDCSGFVFSEGLIDVSCKVLAADELQEFTSNGLFWLIPANAHTSEQARPPPGLMQTDLPRRVLLTCRHFDWHLPRQQKAHWSCFTGQPPERPRSLLQMQVLRWANPYAGPSASTSATCEGALWDCLVAAPTSLASRACCTR